MLLDLVGVVAGGEPSVLEHCSSSKAGQLAREKRTATYGRDSPSPCQSVPRIHINCRTIDGGLVGAMAGAPANGDSREKVLSTSACISSTILATSDKTSCNRLASCYIFNK